MCYMNNLDDWDLVAVELAATLEALTPKMLMLGGDVSSYIDPKLTQRVCGLPQVTDDEMKASETVLEVAFDGHSFKTWGGMAPCHRAVQFVHKLVALLELLPTITWAHGCVVQMQLARAAASHNTTIENPPDFRLMEPPVISGNPVSRRRSHPLANGSDQKKRKLVS